MARKTKTVARRSLPARGAKTSAIAGLAAVTKMENTLAAEDEGFALGMSEIDGALEAAIEKPITKYIPLAPEKPIQVFTTFKSNINLDEGVCVVRKLANGEYQIVNLSTAGAGTMGSKDTGTQLFTDKALLKILDIKQKDWDDARVKCSQAIMSAAGEIFYFFVLPLEIREMIYKLCLKSKKRLTAGPGATDINLAFLRTSRTVYDEAIQFFQQNTFMVDDPSPALRELTKGPNTNIRKLVLEVQGAFKKDQEVFDFVASCTALKELEVIYTWRVHYANRQRPQYTHRRNTTEFHQFRDSSGFDILCALRGLEKVKVTVEPVRQTAYTHHFPPNKYPEATRAKFEEFLRSEVTKPQKTKAELLAEQKAEQKAAATEKRRLQKAVASRKNGRTARKRKASSMMDDDSEDEYDGTSRSWAH